MDLKLTRPLNPWGFFCIPASISSSILSYRVDPYWFIKWMNEPASTPWSNLPSHTPQLSLMFSISSLRSGLGWISILFHGGGGDSGNSCTLVESGTSALQEAPSIPVSYPQPWLMDFSFQGNDLISLLCGSGATRTRTLPSPPMPGSLMPSLSFVNLCPSDWILYPVHQPQAIILHWMNQSPSTLPPFPPHPSRQHLYLCPMYLIKFLQILTDIVRYHEACRFQIQVFSAPLDIELEMMKGPD